MNYPNLNKLGFKGDLLWVLNEEGSGAKYYKSSAYYPDSLTNPVTNSGITIDPGLDLANAEEKIIQEVFDFYFRHNVLTAHQIWILKEAVKHKYKKQDAIQWIIKYRDKYFKNKFLVPDAVAAIVFDMYTAPDYWKAIASGLPEILSIKEEYLAPAVHTALLSEAYNQGWGSTIKRLRDLVKEHDWKGVAQSIKDVKHRMEALDDRDEREASLILDALEYKKDFMIPFEYINPRPLTTIPGALRKSVLEMFLVEVPPKPEIKL